MTGKITLQELVRDAGITPVLHRQPLPAPTQPAIIASQDDHMLARELLVQQRKNNPDYRDPNKQLKRIFKSSKEKEKIQNTANWEFTQDEVDRALSSIIDKPTSSAGLVQAFLSLGAKVNFVELQDEKKNKSSKQPNVSSRRRSTVLQRAATVRRVDSVALLASAGADQTALDEALKAAIATNDQACIQELLRHGADINKFPNALATAVRSNDQNFIRLLLRAPKAYRTEVISSCLPAAVQLKSEQAISLLIGYGGDPNFNGADALSMAISQREYRLAVALVAGPVRLTPASLRGPLEQAMGVPTAQETFQYIQLLLCCGLPSNSPGLPGLLASACKRNDTQLAWLLLDYGVDTSWNEAECLRCTLSNSEWSLAEAIIQTPLSSAHASFGLAVLPSEAPKLERLRVIGGLLQRGAQGPPLTRWVTKAVEESDTELLDLLLHNGASVESNNGGPLRLAILRKDRQSLHMLLSKESSPQALSQTFPLLSKGYSPPERLETMRLLLQHGARGVEVDQALVQAVAEPAASRDVTLITELVRNGANVDHGDGEAIHLAVAQADVGLLQLLCTSKPSLKTTSAALPSAFNESGDRHQKTFKIIKLLLSNGTEQEPALRTLQLAMKGGLQNIDIIDCFLQADEQLLAPTFRFAIELDSSDSKTPIIAHLLQRGIPKETLGEALAKLVPLARNHTDENLLKLLLEHGASVNYREGEPLIASVASGLVRVTELLLGGSESLPHETLTKAFRTLFKDTSGFLQPAHSKDKFEMASKLLQKGVDQSAIDTALQVVLGDSYQEQNSCAIVDLLLRHRADVNIADGACFVLAARREDSNLLARLLAHGPDFSTIVPALLSSGLKEGIIVKALEQCFENGLDVHDLDKDHHGHAKLPALILAIQEYPRGALLVQSLLDHGCNPDITAPTTVDPAAEVEVVPALMCALAQPQKRVSSSVIQALLGAGASPTRPAPVSEVTPIALAAREGRLDITEALLNRGADPSVRDKWNRSALFYASSSLSASIAQLLSGSALKDDGSLHEAARSLQLEVVTLLLKQGHNPNFPSRLHQGRSALGELCLNAEASNGIQRTKARQIISLFLDHGANPSFKARNERSAVILALDNPHSSLQITDALLETKVWENLNDERHMYRDNKGVWYSPIKYVELVPSPSRARHKQELIDLLRDKGCEPRYYAEGPEQPEGAIGMPAPIAERADRRESHLLSLQLAKEASEHTRMLDEATHRDILRRKREQHDADLAAAAAAKEQWQALEQSKHEFEVERVRAAEHMKRTEKIAWHNLQMEQERDFATQRQQIEDRKASASYAHEARLVKQRQAELEHRTGVERKALLEKEQLFDRNVSRQKQLTDRLDESAQLHARLRQDRPAIEGAKWGSVD
jgi:ankyrin repeat protein